VAVGGGGGGVAKRRRLNGSGSGGGGGGGGGRGGAHELFHDTVAGVALVLVRRAPDLGAEWVGRLRLGTVCASRLAPLDRLPPDARSAVVATLGRLGVFVGGGAPVAAAAAERGGARAWAAFPLEVCGLPSVAALLSERGLLRGQAAGGRPSG